MIDMEPEASAHLYLGCIHEKKVVKLPGGLSAQAIVYNMESYFGVHGQEILCSRQGPEQWERSENEERLC